VIEASVFMGIEGAAAVVLFPDEKRRRRL